MKSKKIFKYVSLIFSFLVFSSCLSTKKIEEVAPATQTPIEDISQKDISQDEENHEKNYDSVEIEETEPSNTKESLEELEENAEKIDENDIISNPVEEDSEETFSEPDIFDAAPKDEFPLQKETRPEDEKTQVQDTKEQDFQITQNLSVQNVEGEVNAIQEESSKKIETENDEVKLESDAIKQPEDEKPLEDLHKDFDAQETSKTESEVDFQNKTSAITPSRAMTVKNNQYVDVIYPGSGWIYIGEVENQNLFRYFGRKLGSKDTTFTLRSYKKGKTLLHFYKNDILTSQYIDDYLEVTVEEDSAKSGEKAVAPSYALVVPPKPVRNEEHFSKEKNSNARKINTEENSTITQKDTENSLSVSVPLSEKKQDDNLKTVIQTTDKNRTSFSAPLSNGQSQNSANQNQNQKNDDISDFSQVKNPAVNLLDEAKKSYEAKEYEKALSQIQEYLDSENTKIDEALFVQAQILEADSTIKNIKSALDSYEAIIKKYPTSRFWQNANRRKIYLERYYINIY
ncbi:outer membrane protein assembly factor BamD [Treponema pectinovorum]|uniref:hypothetical protein n=1 Tax=Treponema pectinovorum TaxID=164 RepID=UPI0011C9A341|nr:hypothetical protein [Treponema pectinovorum]